MDPIFLTYPDNDDPRTHLALMTLLSYLGPNPDPDTCNRLFAQQFPGGSYEHLYLPINSARSSTMLFKWGTNNLVLGGCTVGLTHIPGLISAWTDNGSRDNILGANDQFNAATTSILTGVPVGWFTSGQNWLLAGYSYGGASMEALACQINNYLSPSGLFIWTYGAPRPGNADMQRRCLGFNGLRYFNFDDPVVKVPPHTDEAGLLHFALPQAISNGANAQVQPGWGRQLNADGSINRLDYSSIAPSVYTASLASWCVGVNAFGSLSHAIAVYQARMQLALAANVTLRQRAPAPPQDAPLNITRRQRIRIEDTARAALPPGNFPVNPLTQQIVTLQPGGRYRVRRGRDGYYIVYGTDVYGFTDTKKQAKALVREYNATLVRPSIPQPIQAQFATIIGG